MRCVVDCLSLARDKANEILDEDPELTNPDNAVIKNELALLDNRIVDWSRIS